MQLSGITIYPVKSCAGVELDSVELDRFGPAGDRRWMLVDAGGRFISQREQAALALIGVSPRDGGLRLQLGETALDVQQPDPGAPERRVEVWGDQVRAADAGDEAARVLSEHLGVACRLVHMPADAVRLVDGIYAGAGETVSFADGFPLLLISEASLEDLNGRLDNPVPMNRFRPNLVVRGCPAFAEDGWRRIRIGSMELQVAKPCSRSVIPSIDQATGARDSQINRVLAGFRRFRGQILFGQNLLYAQGGRLSLGDSLEVLE